MHLCLVLGCSLLSWRLLAVGRPQLLLLLPHIHLRLLAPIQLLQHLLHLLPLGLALLLDAHLLICCSSCGCLLGYCADICCDGAAEAAAAL